MEEHLLIETSPDDILAKMSAAVHCGELIVYTWLINDFFYVCWTC